MEAGLMTRSDVTAARALRLAAIILAAASVAACHRDKAKTKATAPLPAVASSSGPVAPPPPLTFQQKTDHADVALTLPAALADQPELHRRLYDDEVRDLKTFAESAQADYAENGGAEGGPASMGSEKKEDWTIAAQTSKLLSLRSLTYEFAAGGAHPNIVYGALLWDKSIKQPVALTTLFKPGADFRKVEASLCEGLKTERRQHFGVDASAQLACPRVADTPFQLAPSTQTGKAGGLTFLIAPYALNAMADGPYQVTVPLDTFAPALAPAYADEFAGQPVAGLQRGGK
jgi:hypothetical protein